MAEQNGKTGNGYYANIEDYYDKVHRTTWARRTAGFLSGATLGTLFGGVIGAVAAFIPHVLAMTGIATAASVVVPAAVTAQGAAAVALFTGAALAAPTLLAIGASIALFAGAGAFMGMIINADVAANAASAAAGLEEKEKREKTENGKSASVVPAHLDTVKGDVSKFLHGKGPPLFSWKVAAVTVPLFAAFGALVALNPAMSALVLDHAFAFTGAVKAIVSASVFGMLGSTMGVKMSMITNEVSNFYYKLLTEQLFKKEKSPELSVEPVREPVIIQATAPAIDVAMAPEKTFAAAHKKFSLTDLMLKRHCGCDKDNGMTR